MIDFTEVALRENALRLAVDTIDVESEFETEDVIGRAKEFEAYLRGGEPRVKPEAYKTPPGRPSSVDDHLSRCGACRALVESVGEPVPPWLGGRSAG